MTKTLFLIRHGLGFHQTESFVGGWSDVGLTDHGKKQAALVADRLSHLVTGEVILLSSDLRRALQTAEPIAERLGVEIMVREDLREIGQGVVEGMPRSEAAKLKAPMHPEVLDWRPYEGAETWRELDVRIRKFIAWLERHPAKRFVIVSHHQTIVAIIQNWLRLHDDQKGGIYFSLRNCSLTILQEIDNQRVIVALNDLKHLDEEHRL